MSKSLLFVFSLFLLSFSVFSGVAQAMDDVTGYWLTENKRAVLEIKPCNDNSVCGEIYWIIDGGLQQDIHNEDESLKKRPLCGLEILGGFEQDDPGEWEDGFIYKADDGDLYDADIEVREDGTLKVRGYLGISLLGKTQIWTRVNPKDYKRCAPVYG
ncbi:MAG: DUF2147 domain-containing protein [Pseudomonadota bacterium]